MGERLDKVALDRRAAADERQAMTALPPAGTDPSALIRSKEYRRLLILAAIVGLLVSFASWAFLEVVHWTQVGFYESLPEALGFDSAPMWWPLPILALAGVLTAVAVLRLPGKGGHVPYEGLKSGVTLPIDVPGVLLAAVASLGLGLVLGPEAPLIALSSGVAIFAVKQLHKDSSDQVIQVIAAAAAFAALSSIFGSPVVGAVILIEAAGLGGAMLPLILLPGLMAAGIGSLVFVGMDSWAGLNNSDYTLTAFTLPTYSSPTVSDFAWTVALSLVAAILTFGIIQLARLSAVRVGRHPWALIPAAAVLVGLVAIAFAEITDETSSLVLFSGEDSFGQLLDPTTSLSLGALQGRRVGLVIGQLQGRPHLPGALRGSGGGPHGGTPAWLLRDPGGGGAHGSLRRGGASPATVVCGDRAAAHGISRTRSGADRHRGGRRGLPDDRVAARLARGAGSSSGLMLAHPPRDSRRGRRTEKCDGPDQCATSSGSS
jgi:H+/Cl- antiporter ClcA